MTDLFSSPILLTLAPIYAIFLWLGWRRTQDSGGSISRRRRQVRGLALHISAALCLILAAAGLGIPAPAKQIQLAVATDVSDSIFDLESQNARLNELLKPLDPNNTSMALILFGGTAGTERSMSPMSGMAAAQARAQNHSLLHPTTVVDRSATDIGHAIDYSRGVFSTGPRHSAQGILLLSDFRDTCGGAEKSAAALFGSGVDLLLSPTRLSPSADVRLASILVPESSTLGRSVPIEVSIVAQGSSQNERAPQNVQVVVWRQNRTEQAPVPVGSKTVTLTGESGHPERELRQSVRLLDQPDAPGVYVYTARVSGPNGSEIPNDIVMNNQLSAAVRVSGPSHWAVLTRPGSSLAALCASGSRPLGVDTHVFESGRMPRRADEYKAYTGILVDGLNAKELDEAATLKALEEAIGSGKALVAVGGENAYGAGGHQTGGAWERLLPAEMQPDDDRTRSILFVIDVSKSMADLMNTGGAGVRKIDFAAEQLAHALQDLKPKDRLGLITFSGNAAPAAPLSNDAAHDAFLKAIKDIRIEANTDLLPALKQAQQVLKKDDAEEQLVILLSDGIQTVERPRAQIIDAARELCPLTKGENGAPRRRTMLYTFGIGVGADDFNATGETMLTDLAQTGGGQYSPDFLKLAERLRKTFESDNKEFYVRRENFNLAASYNHPIVAQVKDAWPVLSFRNRVKAKPESETIFWSRRADANGNTSRSDPILILSGTHWPGISRRAVLTLSPDGAKGAWLASEGGQKLLPALLSWAEAKADPSLGTWSLEGKCTQGKWLDIEARGKEPNGAPLNGVHAKATMTALYINAQENTAAARVLNGQGIDAIPLQASAPGVYSARMSLPEQGIYRLTLLDGTQTLYERLISVPYPAEYQRFGTDRVAMQALALKAGGSSRVIETFADLAAWAASKEASGGRYSLVPWLLVCGLLLLLIEFALRKG